MARPKKEQIQKDIEKAKNSDFIFAHGRRKTATAKVRLYQGSGPLIVNNQPIDKYFPGAASLETYLKPLNLTNTLNKMYASIKVEGSGKFGQLGAVVHGISRALIEYNPEFRPILKREGLLTRDPRAKERRKYGLAQKARKGKQSPRR